MIVTDFSTHIFSTGSFLQTLRLSGVIPVPLPEVLPLDHPLGTETLMVDPYTFNYDLLVQKVIKLATIV